MRKQIPARFQMGTGRVSVLLSALYLFCICSASVLCLFCTCLMSIPHLSYTCLVSVLYLFCICPLPIHCYSGSGPPSEPRLLKHRKTIRRSALVVDQFFFPLRVIDAAAFSAGAAALGVSGAGVLKTYFFHFI